MKVEIYTWSNWPFYRRAKQLLDSKNVDYLEYVFDGDETARDAMAKRVMVGALYRKSLLTMFMLVAVMQFISLIGQLDDLLAQPAS